MEELAELVKLKDERRSIFTFIEPSLNIFDDYININSEKKVEMVYCINSSPVCCANRVVSWDR